MLLRYGADINQQTKSGDTPCHLAAYRGFPILVQMLAENGASLRMVNNKYRTPLEDAQNQGHTSIVRYLSAVSQIRKYLYSVASNGEGGGGVKETFKRLFSNAFNYTKKCADFLFSFSLCFPQVLNLSTLAWRQIGNPKSLLPCKWCNCFPETMLSDITLERTPKIPLLHPKTTSPFYRTESHILGWLSGIFNFFDFYTFSPDIRRAITWRALAFGLDRYWIYSYSILQNKDVNRNMIGGFFFPPIYFLVVEMFRGRTIYNRELIIWRDQCVSLSALVSQQYSA